MSLPLPLDGAPPPVAAASAASAPVARRGTARRTAPVLALVLLFWWGATGVLIALQRNAGTRIGALLLAAVSAPLGLWLVARARAATTERSAAGAFFGGALCWTAVSASFYGGWIVGPAPSDALAYTILGHALDAIRATSYSSVLTAALLVALVRAGRGAGMGHFGACTFALFWAAHELAKLNVFFGVANPGTQFLPEYLTHLRRYFGPTENSGLLAPSVLALSVLTAWLAVHAIRVRVPARRVGTVLLAAIALLAAFEHMLLGVPRSLGWWDLFLSLRGAP